MFEILDRLFDSLLESHARLPAEDLFRTSDIWLANLRVVHWQWFVFDRRFCSGNTNNFVGELFNGHLARITQVDWLVDIPHGQLANSVGPIASVTKRTALRPIARTR